MADIIKLSSSGIEEYINCPRKFNLHYYARIKEPKSEKSSLQWLRKNERGTLIHRVMELYTNKGIISISKDLIYMDEFRKLQVNNDILNKLDAIEFENDLFEKVWCTALAETENMLSDESKEAVEIPLTAREKELSEIEETCRKAIQYMISQMKANRQYPVMTEKKFGQYKDDSETATELIIKIQNKELYALNGSIDRVDYDIEENGFIVVDYKSGNIANKRKLRTNERDDLIQDKVYALALKTMCSGISIIGSRYIFVSSENQEIPDKMTEESIESFRDRLNKIAEDIKTKEDKACRDDKDHYPDCENTCKYCGYNELCMAYSELITNQN